MTNEDSNDLSYVSGSGGGGETGKPSVENSLSECGVAVSMREILEVVLQRKL